MIVLGPVIGKVTGTSARILIEVESSMAVTCSLSTAEHGGVSRTKTFTAGRPGVFVFTGLTPCTHYSVAFDAPTNTKEPLSCSFTTLPTVWTLEARPPRIAVVSCNKIWTTHKDVEPSGDLWGDLEQRVKERSVDYLLHIGDNIYADSDLYLIEGHKRDFQGPDDECRFAVAKKLIEDKPRDQWVNEYENMCEIFRDVYRLTWGHPPTRRVLANIPNLMILDDHEIRDDWGDTDEHRDPKNPDHYVAMAAYQCYNEYQRQLYEDFTLHEVPMPNYPPMLPPQPAPHCAYHFHSFGEVGFLFLDLRACKTFHWNDKTDKDLPHMGAAQWDALREALGEGGTFDGCRFVLVLASVPVAYLSHTVNQLAVKVVNDLNGSWTATDHLKETEEFLKLLFAWRRNRPDGHREVTIVGGDVHEGGMTEIVDTTVGVSRGSTRPASARLKQMTSSAIANKRLPWYQAAAPTLARELSARLPGHYSFDHFGWVQDRNYGLLSAFIDTMSTSAGGNGQCVDYDLQLVSSDGKKVTEHEAINRMTDPKTVDKG